LEFAILVVNLVFTIQVFVHSDVVKLVFAREVIEIQLLQNLLFVFMLEFNSKFTEFLPFVLPHFGGIDTSSSQKKAQ